MRNEVKRFVLGSLLVGLVLAIGGCSDIKVMIERPFGTSEDVAYGDKLWEKLEEKGYNSTPSILFKGTTPHGQIVEVLEGKIDGKPVLVKRNYRGENLNITDVIQDRAKYLKAITVMNKREKGYDSENQNWFYAKYKADGSYFKKMGMIPVVGRVAKGIDNQNCISCHSTMPDFRFVMDKSRIKQL